MGSDIDSSTKRREKEN